MGGKRGFTFVSQRLIMVQLVLDSGFHAVDGFRIPRQWNLDPGFQSLVGFRIPKPRISDSTRRNFPDSVIRITLRG